MASPKLTLKAAEALYGADQIMIEGNVTHDCEAEAIVAGLTLRRCRAQRILSEVDISSANVHRLLGMSKHVNWSDSIAAHAYSGHRFDKVIDAAMCFARSMGHGECTTVHLLNAALDSGKPRFVKWASDISLGTGCPDQAAFDELLLEVREMLADSEYPDFFSGNVPDLDEVVMRLNSEGRIADAMKLLNSWRRYQFVQRPEW